MIVKIPRTALAPPAPHAACSDAPGTDWANLGNTIPIDPAAVCFLIAGAVKRISQGAVGTRTPLPAFAQSAAGCGLVGLMSALRGEICRSIDHRTANFASRTPRTIQPHQPTASGALSERRKRPTGAHSALADSFNCPGMRHQTATATMAIMAQFAQSVPGA